MSAARCWRAWSCTVRVACDDERSVDAAAAELAAILERVERAASRFRTDSALSKANAYAGTPVAVPRDLADLVGAALDAAEQSGGMVDPTIGASLLRWGYDRDIADVRSSGPPVRASVPTSTWRQVRLERGVGVLTVPPGTVLDLGASGKAFTADYAARTLHRRFHTPVLVELGGDLAVAGRRAGGWAVRVAEREGGPGQTIVLHEGGLTTSTTTIRRWQRGGRIVHHIIDPRTGAPADGCWRTVTVAAGSALRANTASTAAIILGEEAESWLRARNLAARLVHRDGHLITTPGWPAAAWEVAS